MFKLLKSLPDIIAGLFRFIVDGIGAIFRFIGDVFVAIWDGIRWIINAIVDGFNSVARQFDGAIKHVPDILENSDVGIHAADLNSVTKTQKAFGIQE